MQIRALVKRLEQLTRTDLRYVGRGAFWLLNGQGLTMITSFLTTIAFARYMSSDQYGTYRYLLSAYGLLTLFTLPGIRTAVTRAVGIGDDQAVHIGAKTQIQTALLGSALSIAASIWYFMHGNALLGYGMLAIAVFLPLTDTLDLSAYFQGKKRFKDQVIYSSSITLVGVLTVMAGLFVHLQPLTLFVAFLGSSALIRGILFATFAPLNVTSLNATAEQKDSIVKFGRQLSYLSSISIAAYSLDKILLYHFLDAGTVAQYSFALAIPNQLRSLFKHLGTLALPRFSQYKENHVYQRLIPRLPFLVAAITSLITLYIITAPLIFKYLFPKYISVVHLSQLFCLSIIDTVTYTIATAFTTYKRTNLLTIMSVVTNTTNILLLLILIPFYGIEGAIFAVLISRLITTALGVGLLYWMRRKTALAPADLAP